MKIVTVIGARPQMIKASAVSREIARTAGLTEVMLHTGQHYDDQMSTVFFDQLGMPTPQYNLGVGSGSHGRQTARMLEGIEDILKLECPHWVLVYGDTNSTLAASLAAGKLHTPIAHVESGLRSFNRKMPEEINRVLTDHLSNALFAPTELARNNLLKEGISASTIHVVGDVMLDVALQFANDSTELNPLLIQLGLLPQQYVLATIHRAENTDDAKRISCIIEALLVTAQTIPVILPLHPRSSAIIADRIGDLNANGVRIIDPVGYLEMLVLEANAAVVATDSGGVQKEAYFHSVPCVTFRDETEWTELVEHGWNIVHPPLDHLSLAETIIGSIGRVGDKVDLYGDGRTSARIVNVLLGNPL